MLKLLAKIANFEEQLEAYHHSMISHILCGPDHIVVADCRTRSRPDEENAANAELIRVSTNSASVQQARIDELEEALRFYADKDNYDDNDAPGNRVGFSPDEDKWETDDGEIARNALLKGNAHVSRIGLSNMQ